MSGRDSEPTVLPTDPKSIAADIIRELREHPEHWTKGELASDASGMWVDFDDPKACRWCLYGHVKKRVMGTSGHRHTDYPRSFHEAAFGHIDLSGTSFGSWNDDHPGRTVDDVIALCEFVIYGSPFAHFRRATLSALEST